MVPATPLLINEVLHISDGTPGVVPATPLLINEVLHISDGTPAVVPATPLLINEVLHVSDTPGPIYPVVVAAVVAVSYTHLDVYKRQILGAAMLLQNLQKNRQVFLC